MTTLKSAISPTSPAFKSNAVAMAELVQELRERMAVTRAAGLL